MYEILIILLTLLITYVIKRVVQYFRKPKQLADIATERLETTIKEFNAILIKTARIVKQLKDEQSKK